MGKEKRTERRTSKRTDARTERRALDDYTTFPLGNYFLGDASAKTQGFAPTGKALLLRFS